MRVRQILGVALIAASLSPTRSHAQGVSGYYVGPRASLPVSLVEGENTDRFRVVVLRVAADSSEFELIERAERLYPSPELIADSVASSLTRLRSRRDSVVVGFVEERFREAAAEAGPRWWWLLSREAHLPFALTGGAVAQYLEAFRKLRSGPNPYAEDNPGVEHKAELVYTATVTLRGSGHIVELKLKWSMHCGPLCGLRLEHARVVEFDSTGVVVRIEGDRQPTLVVS
jgi:hypothetical protein